MISFQYGTPIQKPYALYIHGLESSAASGTKSSLARSLEGYEWLAPEITHNPLKEKRRTLGVFGLRDILEYQIRASL